MDRKQLEASLQNIHHLLSHLNGEVTELEAGYARVLSVLERFEDAIATDDLTGLLRRNAFFKRWEALLQECQRLQLGCGVLVIDIDHFKKINDTHGHPTGDEVIKRVAGMLKQYVSPHCIAARLGGEEFALAIRGTDAEILGIAEFVRRGAERLHGPVIGPEGEKPGANSGGVEWKCTLSIGMASAGSQAQSAGPTYDASRLLKGADLALYQAKNKGRNRVCA